MRLIPEWVVREHLLYLEWNFSSRNESSRWISHSGKTKPPNKARTMPTCECIVTCLILPICDDNCLSDIQ